MDNFLERLDSLLDNDPFEDINENLLAPNDYELLEKYRVRYLDDRKRIREERKTKSFEEIMQDLVEELSHKPDISSLYKTLEDPLIPISDVHPIEPDTSADEQDDLEHCTTLIDPTKSIGRSIENEQTNRKLEHYTERSRRNTYTLEDSSSSSDDHEQQQHRTHLINTKPDYVRVDSQGFESQQHENPFQNVTDARLTFSLPQKHVHYTHQQAQRILHEKLGALIKGHLTRQVLRTEHMKKLIQTLNDTRKFAVDFQSQCLQTKTKLDPDDINIIDQLIRQVQQVLDEIHAIFHQYSSRERIAMIIRQERTRRINQRIAKDSSIVTTNKKNENPSRQTEYRRPENIRRHVKTVTNRPVQSTIPKQTRPMQRKSRPSTSSTNPPRSSSANSTTTQQHTFRPPLRLAPASPLFRNRFK